MIDCKKISLIAESAIQGTDVFVVNCTCSPSNEVELLLDSDTSVSLDVCAAVNRAVDEAFDRDSEDYSLTVASSGIGEPLRVMRQYHKLVGGNIELLLKSGMKIVATLDGVQQSGVDVSYDEKVAIEGKKRKELQHVSAHYAFDEIKSACEYLDYK